MVEKRVKIFVHTGSFSVTTEVSSEQFSSMGD